MDFKKNERLIAKFNRETKEGKLYWQISWAQPVLLNNGEVVIDHIYYANIEDKTLRLFKYSVKDFLDEERYEWTTSIRLEFIDSNWKSVWAFQEIAILRDLYETVRYKTSGVEAFFDKYLGEDEDKKDEGDKLQF